MYYLCIRLQINISVLFCSVLFNALPPWQEEASNVRGMPGGRALGDVEASI